MSYAVPTHIRDFYRLMLVYDYKVIDLGRDYFGSYAILKSRFRKFGHGECMIRLWDDLGHNYDGLTICTK
jgi:hypothetical protein